MSVLRDVNLYSEQQPISSLRNTAPPAWMMLSFMSSDVGWHIRDKLWPVPKHGSVLLYVHRNRKAHQDGNWAQDGHLDFHAAPELCCRLHFRRVCICICWVRCSIHVSGTSSTVVGLPHSGLAAAIRVRRRLFTETAWTVVLVRRFQSTAVCKNFAMTEFLYCSVWQC